MSSKDKSVHNKQRVQACLMRGLHPFYRQVAFSPSESFVNIRSTSILASAAGSGRGALWQDGMKAGAGTEN